MPTPSITIVGLGPGNPDARTIATQRALDSASKIILRTSIHPGVDDLIQDHRVVACDDLYTTADSFDSVYESIAARVIFAAQGGPVVFAVPGSPLFGETTVRLVRDRARDEGIEISILPAVSALDQVAAAADLDLMAHQPQMLDALELASAVHDEPFSGSMIAIDPTRPLIVGQVFDRRTASDVKHALSRLYPDHHRVTVVASAGTGDQRVLTMHIAELDHQEHDHLTTIVVPPLAPLEAFRSAATLYRVIARLRAPEGCPWDRQQTHESIADKAIEEAHEVAEAIAGRDLDALRDELGDLMLLVALHAQIAEEAGEFSIEDVFEAVTSKLIRRHPHVFGESVAESPDDVLAIWKQVKAEEKGLKTPEDTGLRYDQLPRTMSVIERIRRAEGDVTTGAGADDAATGDELLAIIERMLAAGIDPEQALERAYRNARLST